MTDYTKDTPYIGRWYCPGCETTADPITEVLEVRWCGAHAVNYTAPDDARVALESFPSGNGESEGLNNAAFQRLIS